MGMEQALDYDQVGLAEAKASLSAYVTQVEHTGVPIVLMRYNKPAALICPLPRQASHAGRARGVLHAYADTSKRQLEEEAFTRAMEAKHAHAS